MAVNSHYSVNNKHSSSRRYKVSIARLPPKLVEVAQIIASVRHSNRYKLLSHLASSDRNDVAVLELEGHHNNLATIGSFLFHQQGHFPSIFDRLTRQPFSAQISRSQNNSRLHKRTVQQAFNRPSVCPFPRKTRH